MKTLKFVGYSDDTFACTGPGIDVDKDTCASGKPVTMLVASASHAGGIIVVGQYAPGHADGWLIGVSNRDPSHDDVPIPAWPIRIERSERGYSPMLLIEAPDDVKVILLGREPDEDKVC